VVARRVAVSCSGWLDLVNIQQSKNDEQCHQDECDDKHDEAKEPTAEQHPDTKDHRTAMPLRLGRNPAGPSVVASLAQHLALFPRWEI
jgi:hypothetical protein